MLVPFQVVLERVLVEVGLCKSAENEHRLQKSFQSVMSVGIRRSDLFFGELLRTVNLKPPEWLRFTV